MIDELNKKNEFSNKISSHSKVQSVKSYLCNSRIKKEKS